MFVMHPASRLLGSATFWHRPPLSPTAHLTLLDARVPCAAGRVHQLHATFAHVGLQGVVAHVGLELPPAAAPVRQ